MSGGANYLQRRMRRLERRRMERERKRKISRGDFVHHILSSSESKEKKERNAGIRELYNKIIELPENFNLTDNYRESIDKINEVRKINRIPDKNRRAYVDFDGIRKIGAAAALVLAAEFEVANINEKKWEQVFDDNWSPEVRRLLYDMGFYELLNLRSNDKEIKERENPDEEFFRFHSQKVNIMDTGKVSSDISDEINNKFAEGNLQHLGVLKSGISEAVLNTRQHAYSINAKNLESSRWWISASLNKSNGEIKVICYDRGISIPVTLRRKFKDVLQKLLWVMKFKSKNDAKLIENTMKENKIRSGLDDGRGYGLPGLKEFIDQNKEGKLIVMSKNGKVTYGKSSNGETEWKAERLPVPIMGTLIVWSTIRTGTA